MLLGAGRRKKVCDNKTQVNLTHSGLGDRKFLLNTCTHTIRRFILQRYTLVQLVVNILHCLSPSISLLRGARVQTLSLSLSLTLSLSLVVCATANEKVVRDNTATFVSISGPTFSPSSDGKPSGGDKGG
jgi:hypothetical protein